MRRAKAVFGVGTLLLAGPLSGRVPALSQGRSAPVPTKFNYLNQTGVATNAAMWVAVDKGFLALENIQTSLIDTTATIGVQAAIVAGGTADSMLISLTALYTARQKGLNLKMLPGLIFSDRGAAVKKGRESEIPVVKTPADLPRTLRALKGKTIGVPGLGVSAHLEMQAMLREVGLDPQKDVTFLQVTPGEPSEAAIARGTIDLIYSSTNTTDAIVADGIGTTVFTALQSGPPGLKGLTLTGFVVTDKFLNDHPDFERRFERAIDRTIDFMKTGKNLDEVTRILVAHGLKSFATLRELVASLPYQKTIDAKIAQNAIDWGTTAGMLPPQPKLTLSEVFTTAALAKK